MQNFSFLGDVQVVFPLLFQAGRRMANGGRLEKTKIRLSLSPARLSLGLAELGKKLGVAVSLNRNLKQHFQKSTHKTTKL